MSYFRKYLNLSWGHRAELVTYCLESLANGNCWRATEWDYTWSTVFLVHSAKTKEKRAIHKSLQFLADVFLGQGDENTAISLLIIALDGFTQMDVHCSRAECMLRLGDIEQDHGNVAKAVDLWNTAKLLFERSSQAKQVAQINKRLANITQADSEEPPTKLVVHLSELNVPEVKPTNEKTGTQNMSNMDMETRVWDNKTRQIPDSRTGFLVSPSASM
jgi:hypothetical protein